MILSCALFFSCSKIMGYSVLLWNLPEQQLQDGDVVPVYIRSNISHVYVIGVADGKVEVPLWQLTEPVSKSKVKKVQARYASYSHTYASVAANGLPMRAEPVNTAKQVYRLRKNETIKLLYKVNGQSPMTGGKPLPGEWLRVLTSDGTTGCCFSYNLRPFETDITGQRVGGEVQEEDTSANAALEELLARVWYPDSYKNMIDSKRVDPAKLNPSYNFTLDPESKALTFRMPKISESWTYTGAEATGANAYQLTGIPVIVTVRKGNYIVVRYTGASGKPEDFNLVTIDGNLEEIVAEEQKRRENEYEQIFMFGPNFKSNSYGTLSLNDDHSFVWGNNRLLVSSNVISAAAKGRGIVHCKYFLGKALSASYDGVITFQFDDMKKEVNFLYKIEENGLRFEDATGSAVDNSTIKDRGLSPLVIFMSKVE